MLITGKTAQVFDLMSLKEMDKEPCHKLSPTSFIITTPSRRCASPMTPLIVEVLRGGTWVECKSKIVHHLIGVIDFPDEEEAVRVTGHYHAVYRCGETAEWRINSWHEQADTSSFGVDGGAFVAIPKWKATLFDVFIDPTHKPPRQVLVSFDYKDSRRYVGMGRVRYDGDIAELEGLGTLSYAAS